MMLSCSYPKEILLIENTENTNDRKRKYTENSAFLWHRRLGHVSKERLQLLIKQNILPTLDFSDLVDCIECVKGKFAKQKRGCKEHWTVTDCSH
jgi:hypothetical protein